MLYKVPELPVHDLVAELQRIRRAWRINVNSLADRAGLGRTSVIYMEQGRRSPTLKSLAQYADALGYEIVLRPKKEA